MTEKSNSLRPYNVTRKSDFFYSFITDSGIFYTAYFVCCDGYDEKLKDSYMFNFEHTEYLGLRRHDGRIRATIAYITEEFFNRRKNSMIYVCDSTDGREMSRKRLFDRWVRDHGIPNIQKKDIDLPGEQYNLLSSIFIHRDNPDKDSVIEAFTELVYLLSD